MTTSMQFLHTMRTSAYLEQALQTGLMFTDHAVKFNPYADHDAAALAMSQYSLPALLEKARTLGVRDLDLNVLSYGLGSISGQIPMICFTEVHQGRDLFLHYMNFGAYGLVVKKAWLESCGGDRVVYAGPNSALTQRLHRLFVDHQIAGLHVNNGKLVFDTRSLEPILNLLALIQGRGQLAEAEWRIAGEHGFTGRKRTTGDRIPLPLEAIDVVLVQNKDDVQAFEEILKSLPGASTAARMPPVLQQPPVLD